MSRINSNRVNLHQAHVPSNETDKAISFINNNNFGWKADTCMLQSTHPEYGTHCDKKKLILKGSTNLLQTDSKVKASSTKIFGENTPEF